MEAIRMCLTQLAISFQNRELSPIDSKQRSQRCSKYVTDLMKHWWLWSCLGGDGTCGKTKEWSLEAEKGKRTNLPRTTSRNSGLSFWLWLLKQKDSKFVLFQATKFEVICYSSNRKLIWSHSRRCKKNVIIKTGEYPIISGRLHRQLQISRSLSFFFLMCQNWSSSQTFSI